MNTNMYIVNAVLVLLVVRQIRVHRLDLASLALPVIAVGAAAFFFLHSVPGSGNDVALELFCLLAGAAMGGLAGLLTHVWRGADGRPAARAGWLAAILWITGVGGRMAFAFAASHGAGPAIARFSAEHQITGSAAWIAALIMMALADVLARLVVLYLRGRQAATAGPASTAPAAGSTRA